MSILIFLVLLGLAVLLWPYIVKGAVYLLIYPALLGLLLLLFPSTRGWGIVILLGSLIYYGIKETVNDSKGKSKFVKAAKEAGCDRRSIIKMIRSKKPTETWDDCINQLNGIRSTLGANPDIPTVLRDLTLDEANDFIKDDAQRAITLMYAIEQPNYICKGGLSGFSRDNYKVEIDYGRAESLLSALCTFKYSPKVIVADKGSGYDDISIAYKLNRTVSDEVSKYVDKQIAVIIKSYLKLQREHYKLILSIYKSDIDNYSKSFISLSKKTIRNVDEWGDYDRKKLDDLKLEYIYRIFKFINKKAYQSDNFEKDWADKSFESAVKNINEDQTVDGTPFWMKRMYNVDLPKLLEPYTAKHLEKSKSNNTVK